jgi:hypothetical protein
MNAISQFPQGRDDEDELQLRRESEKMQVIGSPGGKRRARLQQPADRNSAVLRSAERRPGEEWQAEQRIGGARR